MTHVVGEMMNAFAGVDILHVPYKGSGPALIDVLAGQVDMTFISTVVGVASSPTEFDRFLKEDIVLQTRIAKQAGIKPQ